MAHELVYNTTDGPVVVDDVGHVLGGREYGAADGDRIDASHGALVRVSMPKSGDVNPDAQAAADRVAAINGDTGVAKAPATEPELEQEPTKRRAAPKES